MIALESLFKSQINALLNLIYFIELKHNTTETIKYTIPYIFTYLFQRYSQVSPQRLQEEEPKVQNKICNDNDPPIVIFNAIQDLSQLTTAANIEKLQ